MGNKYLKVENAAKNLGFTSFPLTVLYGRPKSYKDIKSGLDKTLRFLGIYGTTSGIITDTARIILEFLEHMYQLEPRKLKKINEPTEKPCFFFGYGFMKKVHKYYFLAPTEKLFIELNNRVSSGAGYMKKHGFQLKIYSSEEEHKYTIANEINRHYVGGILKYIDDWETIEKFFNVSSDECIKNWNSFLEHS